MCVVEVEVEVVVEVYVCVCAHSSCACIFAHVSADGRFVVGCRAWVSLHAHGERAQLIAMAVVSM